MIFPCILQRFASAVTLQVVQDYMVIRELRMALINVLVLVPRMATVGTWADN